MQQARDIQCAAATSGSVSFKMLIVKLTLLTRRIRHQSRTPDSKTYNDVTTGKHTAGHLTLGRHRRAAIQEQNYTPQCTATSVVFG
jgi:hypothetical protein